MNKVSDQAEKGYTEKQQELLAVMHEFTDGDVDFHAELVNSFIANFEELTDGAVKALELGDKAEYDALIHKLKPSCITLKYQDFYTQLQEIELSFSEASRDENIRIIRHICDVAIGDLKAIL